MFAVLLVFNAIGILANVLVMLGIKLNKRSLLLPWLVFQLMVILGELTRSIISVAGLLSPMWSIPSRCCSAF